MAEIELVFMMDEQEYDTTTKSRTSPLDPTDLED